MKVIGFAFSDKNQLKAAFSIRRTVFIDEQKVKEVDEFDEYESTSMFCLSYEGEEAVGTARWRISDKGIKLERFAILKEYRNQGHGMSIMRFILNEVPKSRAIYLHAQSTVVSFYESFGFTVKGELFVECDILHYLMYKKHEVNSEMSLQESINHVRDFHEAFSLHVAESPSIKVNKDLIQLRYNLMKEENEEYLQAAEAGDMVEIADALGDMLYILNGTILTHGMQSKIEEVFEEIQRSNMSKLDKDGNPIYREDGKVLKSDLYFKPEIRKILDTN